MASIEICDYSQAVLGGASADCDFFFKLGIKYSSGRNVPVDYVAAHKWFNLAAMKGSQKAVRLRREIAVEMTDAEIAAAQRAARDWVRNGGRILDAAA